MLSKNVNKMRMQLQATDDDDLKGIIQNNPLRVQVLPDKTLIDFYLPQEINTDPKEYIDFFRAIRDARPTDEVVLHINCYGGECSTAFQIIDNLRATQATVTVSIEGNCCSAATMIALAGDQWDIMPHSYFMIHAYSKINWGKRNEINASNDFDKKWLDDSFREIYKGFLTPEEIEQCLEGKDFYFTANETIERLNNYKKDDIEREQVTQKVVDKYQKLINDELTKELKKFDDAHTEKPAKSRSKSKK